MKNNEWNEIREKLKEELDVSDYSLIASDAMARMEGFNGVNFVLSVANAFLEDMLNKNTFIRTLEKVVGEHYGTKVTAFVIEAGRENEIKKKLKAPVKPKMCEVLGVEVGERFRIRKDSFKSTALYIDQDGSITTDDGRSKITNGETILEIINNPSIIIKNKLTDKEQKICELIGAKWITMDEDEPKTVELWGEKPKLDEGFFVDTTGESYLGEVSGRIFTSVKPGDFIYVGE